MKNKLNFGDIVLLLFPFSDGNYYKRRPAIIIYDFNDDDIIVCRITSQIYKTQNDIFIEEWENVGLKLPSVIRVHKIATLEKNLIESLLGKVDDSTKAKVYELIAKLPD